MPGPPAPQRAALLNFLLPGLGYLALGRRQALAGLLLAYCAVTLALAALHLLTLQLHWHHLSGDAFPGVGAQMLLFGAQHGFVAAAVAWDAWREGSAAANSSSSAAAIAG